MPPSYREEVTSIGSLVFLEIARKVKVLVNYSEKSLRVFEEKYNKSSSA